MSHFHSLTIKEVNRETDKAVSISFDLPQNLKDVFKFKAGQYITLKATINNIEVRRDYSLCVSPKSGELKIEDHEKILTYNMKPWSSSGIEFSNFYPYLIVADVIV